MKLNKKGFMLAEVIVVSVILIGTVVGLYAGFNKMYANYRERNAFDDVETLYCAKVIKDFLIDQEKINDLIKKINNTSISNDITDNASLSLNTYEIALYNAIKKDYNVNKIYFSIYDLTDKNINGASQNFTNYVNYLKKDSTLATTSYSHRIIVETKDNKYATIGIGIK